MKSKLKVRTETFHFLFGSLTFCWPTCRRNGLKSSDTYLSWESGVFLRGGGRNLFFLEVEGASLSAGGGGGGSKPEGGGGVRGPAW